MADASPTTADAWFQRGNAHVSQQQWQQALDCYCEAVRVDPGHAAAHAFIGNVLRQLRQPDAAMAAYDRAIAVKPDYVEVHYNRGVLLHQARQMREALQSYDAALSINPSVAEVHCSRGDVLKDLGRLDEALASYEGAIAANGGYSRAHLHRGVLLQQMGRPEAALASFDAAIRIAPAHAGAHAERGLVLMALRQPEAAVASFDTAIRLRPEVARVFSNRARAQADLGLMTQARASHDQAVVLDPDDAGIHFNRGVFLADQADWSGAIASHQAAIALQPDHAEAYCSLGLAQQEADQIDAAMDSYARALAIKPTLATAFNNRGNLWRSRRQYAKALLDFRQAVALEPHSAEAHYNIGQLALLQGDLAAGWPEYEWRRLIREALSVPARNLPQPAWSGEQSLRGKRIFLHAEQGLGDTIQFCRYARLVADLGAEVVLEVQPQLGGLLATLDGVSQLVLAGGPIPHADYQCSVMSLPGALRTTLETIPGRTPYLRADPLKVARWRERPDAGMRPRIGLCWSGNPRNAHDSSRSVALARWIAHLPEGFDYFRLQKDVRAADLAALQSVPGIRSFDDGLMNFDGTAALIETLDLVISVDTSIAHLGGALGCRTWTLLSSTPDWRWLLDRRDSPWYPTMTLYRQPSAGDWDSVLAEVTADLQRSASALLSYRSSGTAQLSATGPGRFPTMP